MGEQEHKVPEHIGFIMDGNRRWAKKHGLPSYEGHLAGYNRVKELVRASANQGVKYLSFYAFSTENWDRTEKEVSYLMKLFLKMITSDLNDVISENIKIIVAGTDERLDKKIIQAARDVESKTANNTGMVVLLCFNYGGQKEIVDAVKKVVGDGEEISIESISKHLYAPEVPPCDIIVRTSGEQRISNFMLWRAAYSELLFMNKDWPDMDADSISEIIKEYSSRSRRYGG